MSLHTILGESKTINLKRQEDESSCTTMTNNSHSRKQDCVVPVPWLCFLLVTITYFVTIP